MADEPKTIRKRERIKLDPLNPEDMLHANGKVRQANRVLRQYSSREVQERARSAAKDAVDALWAIIRSPIAADQAKIAAATALFDRGYGKPTTVAVTANVNTDAAPKDINRKTLEERIAETLSRIDDVESREGEEAQGEDGPPDLRKLN